MKPVALLVLTAWLLVAADAPDKELEKLQGNWTLASLETGDGQSLSDGTLTIKGDKYEARVGEFTVKATIKVDPSKSPKAIDFTYSEGPSEGQTIKGIYSLEGDTFKFYRPLQAGEDRPAKIPSEPGPGMLLVVYKRQKP
jgi:uncharacterized protein (TIGR03067 family)